MSAFDGLGKALRWIRDKQNKKQYQVAEDAGVTKAMLSAYETGKQKPSLDTLEKILGALNVDLAGLFSALQMVNERPQAHAAAGTDPLLGTSVSPAVDVYAALGLHPPLPPREKEALTMMLQGFHSLLRYYHERGQTLVLPPVEPPAS